MNFKMKFLVGLLFAVMVIFFSWVILFAQDTGSEVPDLYNSLLSASMIAYIAAVCGFTKYVRNILNVKGRWALVITFIVSIGYSFVQYRDLGLPSVIAIGLLAGLAGAGIFKGTKEIGKAANPAGTK